MSDNAVQDCDMDVLQAKACINEIREKWAVMEDHVEIRGLTDRLLDAIMEINSAPLRLISELIQNADDAQYMNRTPASLSIEIPQPGLLTFVGNQKPFTKENVIALCNAGQSSKRDDPNTTGEKGLGFKSIFRICDHVFVKSGGYCFRLSRGGLDTIVPKWVESDRLPVQCPLSDHTYIILQLSGCESILSKRQTDQLHEHLFGIQPQILLFLRRLKTIKISSQSRALKLTKSKDDRCSTILIEKSKDGSTESKSFHYMLRSQPSTDTGPRHSSRAQLAFPVSYNSETKKLAPRSISGNLNVFAFLPVMTTEFKFFLNCDWKTNTSREAIHEDNAWNINLRDSLAECFVSSIKSLVATCTDDLRYSCFRYLPDSKARLGHTTQDSDVVFSDHFFRPVAIEIIQSMKDLEVVLDVRNAKYRARQCVLLRSEFKFKGLPLLPARDGLHFAHRQYSQEEDFAALKVIGATPFGKKDFIDASKSLTNAELQATYLEHGPSWFATLYKALKSSTEGSAGWTPTQLKGFRTLKCVPAEAITPAGSVVQSPLLEPDHPALFIRSEDERTQAIIAPLASLAFFVQPQAYVSSHAESFLRGKLGVKIADVGNFGALILELTSINSQLEKLNTVELDSHKKQLKFLLKYASEIDKDYSSLTSATSTMLLRPIKSLLVDETGFLTACYAGLEVHNLLHPCIAEDASLVTELMKLGLQRFPMPSESESESWDAVLKNADRAILLLKHLAKLNKRGLLASNLSNSDFVKAISGLEVRCQDKSVRKLAETAICMPEITETDIPIIDIDPSDRQFQWKKFLSVFGVSTKLDLKLRLKQLARCSKNNCHDLLLVSQIYQSINRLCKSKDDESLVRQEFARDTVLYLPSIQTWVNMDNEEQIFWTKNAWHSLPLPSSVVILDLTYGASDNLFKKVLNLPSLSLNDAPVVFKALLGLTATSTLPISITDERLQDIDIFLDELCACSSFDVLKASPHLDSLLNLPLYAIWNSTPGKACLYQNNGQLIFPDATEDAKMFIDAPELHLLRIPTSSLKSRRKWITYVNAKTPDKKIRFLSDITKIVPIAQGAREIDTAHTLFVKERCETICRYLWSKEGSECAQSAFLKLSRLEVVKVQSISETVCIELDGISISGGERPAFCMSEVTDEKPTILVAVGGDLTHVIGHHNQFMRTLQNYLGGNDNFREFLKDIWTGTDPQIQHYLSSLSIPSLPTSFYEYAQNDAGIDENSTLDVEHDTLVAELESPQQSKSESMTILPNISIKTEQRERSQELVLSPRYIDLTRDDSDVEQILNRRSGYETEDENTAAAEEENDEVCQNKVSVGSSQDDREVLSNISQTHEAFNDIEFFAEAEEDREVRSRSGSTVGISEVTTTKRPLVIQALDPALDAVSDDDQQQQPKLKRPRMTSPLPSDGHTLAKVEAKLVQLLSKIRNEAADITIPLLEYLASALLEIQQLVTNLSVREDQ